MLFIINVKGNVLIQCDIINLSVGGHKGCLMILCLRKLTMPYPAVSL